MAKKIQSKKTSKRSNNKKIIKKIIIEYIYIILAILLMPSLADHIVGNSRGFEGMGKGMIAQAVFCIVMIYVFIVNPIRLLIVYKKDLKNIVPKFKKIICIFLTILPLLFLLFIPLSTVMNNINYENSKRITEKEFKSPEDFQKELGKRGFLYDADIELKRLNSKYEAVNDDNSEYYYETATLMPLFKESYDFYDNKHFNEVINFNSNIRTPGYIYNTILYLDAEDEDLRYAPISRYDLNTYISGKHYPYYEDYYIEFKILYINEDIYAIIGVGQSYDVIHYYGENIRNNYPYNMILSEKDTITTYYDGLYYKDGAINNKGNSFEAKPNKNEALWNDSYYKIKKVDKLDVSTVNKIAKELQNDILKESIENHFNGEYLDES